MKVIFIKDYTDKDSFDQWITIRSGEVGTLLNEATGSIEMTQGFDQAIVLEGVPAGSYQSEDSPFWDAVVAAAMN